jgi:hypothetical protein
MHLQHEDYTFTLLTPCFSGTALGKADDHAEMRIPPIRGHIRFWHRVLFGPGDCNRVWGSTAGDQGNGSRISVRFIGSVSIKHASPKPTMLPHKDKPNQTGPRPALAAGESFTLRLQRLVGCTAADWDHAQRAVKLWLLLGGLGLRSNRAAGSVWPKDDWAPQSADALKTTLQSLGLQKWAVALVGEAVSEEKRKSADELRETASDTIQGNPHQNVFGGIRPRAPSPTKFKVIRLASGPCLLACAPTSSILQEAERLLNAKPNATRWKALGTWNYILP